MINQIIDFILPLHLMAPSFLGGLFGGKKVRFNAPSRQALNLGQLQRQAREADIAAAEQSMALEERLTPEVAALRRESIEGVRGDIDQPLLDSELTGGIRERMLAEMGRDIERVPTSQLSEEARAQRLDDLRLGGRLSVDEANRAILGGLISGEGTGVTGQTLRDIAARQFGLTAEGVRQQRLAAAEASGAQETQEGFNREQLFNSLRNQQTQSILNQGGMLSNLANQEAARRLQIAGLGQSIARPTVGLSGGTVTQLSETDRAAQNQWNMDKAMGQFQADRANAQQKSSMFGTLGGIAGTILGGPIGGAIGSSLFGGGGSSAPAASGVGSSFYSSQPINVQPMANPYSAPSYTDQFSGADPYTRGTAFGQTPFTMGGYSGNLFN